MPSTAWANVFTPASDSKKPKAPAMAANSTLSISSWRGWRVGDGAPRHEPSAGAKWTHLALVALKVRHRRYRQPHVVGERKSESRPHHADNGCRFEVHSHGPADDRRITAVARHPD